MGKTPKRPQFRLYGRG